MLNTFGIIRKEYWHKCKVNSLIEHCFIYQLTDEYHTDSTSALGGVCVSVCVCEGWRGVGTCYN